MHARFTKTMEIIYCGFRNCGVWQQMRLQTKDVCFVERQKEGVAGEGAEEGERNFREKGNLEFVGACESEVMMRGLQKGKENRSRREKAL